MAINKDLFSSHNFQSTIRRYCAQLNWKISELTPAIAVLSFRMRSGRAQTVFISRFQTTLEFSCPSSMQFGSFQNIPHKLSSLLLRENRKHKFGFWCIEELENGPLFCVMHNAEIGLMDASFFEKVVEALVIQCERFDQAGE